MVNLKVALLPYLEYNERAILALKSNGPMFKVIPSLIKPNDLEALCKYSEAELGEDPSSQFFIPRHSV